METFDPSFIEFDNKRRGFMEKNIILEYQKIDKKFPGVQALSDINFKIMHGEIHAIVGENGAGKSTLMKITSGLYQPENGKILMSGSPVRIRNTSQAMSLGISVVPQELNLVPQMSVGENIMLGIEPRSRWGIVKRLELNKKAKETLGSLEKDFNTKQKAEDLSIADQQVVQIARAISFKCNLLILDEPTSSLSETERVSLFKLLRLLKKKGTTIIYISHHMDEVFEISDRITVLRDGKFIATKNTKDTNEDEIVRLMVGRDLKEFLYIRKERKKGDRVILEVRNLSRENMFENVSFKVHEGEILGFAGLVGAGRTEVVSSIFGNPKIEDGEIKVKNMPAKINSPSGAIKLGFGFVPEERKRNGIFDTMSVLHNLTIPFVKNFRKRLHVDEKKEKKKAEELVKQLDVRMASIEQLIKNLSGGNQQKVILSRWLGSGSEILILDEPTRGIDVNAKIEIHSLIAKLAKEGKSIILVSSEMPELLAIADRIIVMREGRIVGEVNPQDVDEEEILRLAMFGSNNNHKQGKKQSPAIVGAKAPNKGEN